MYSGGGDVDTSEGVDRETCWRCYRWMGQSTCYHTWRIIYPTHTKKVIVLIF